jgi:hypothetical protein
LHLLDEGQLAALAEAQPGEGREALDERGTGQRIGHGERVYRSARADRVVPQPRRPRLEEDLLDRRQEGDEERLGLDLDLAGAAQAVVEVIGVALAAKVRRGSRALTSTQAPLCPTRSANCAPRVRRASSGPRTSEPTSVIVTRSRGLMKPLSSTWSVMPARSRGRSWPGRSATTTGSAPSGTTVRMRSPGIRFCPVLTRTSETTPSAGARTVRASTTARDRSRLALAAAKACLAESSLSTRKVMSALSYSCSVCSSSACSCTEYSRASSSPAATRSPALIMIFSTVPWAGAVTSVPSTVMTTGPVE